MTVHKPRACAEAGHGPFCDRRIRLGVAGGGFRGQGFEHGLDAVGSCGYGLRDSRLEGAGGGDVEVQDGAFGGEGDTVLACYFDFEGSHCGLRV